nr:hypothetical protein [Tanacetum cinerariifolium]
MPLTFQPHSPKKRPDLESSKIQKTESSKLVDSSRTTQDSKPKVQNTGLSKSLRPKPIQKPQFKYELYSYTSHSIDDCYRILYCMICKRKDHRTLDHEMYIASLRRSDNYKAQPYQYAYSSKKILKVKEKPFHHESIVVSMTTDLMIVETILSVKSVEVMITLPQDTIVSLTSEEEYELSHLSLMSPQ